MNFKKKVGIALLYAVLICVTVVAAINVRNFIDNPFDTIENFEMADIEETNGMVKFNVLILGLDKTATLSDVIMVLRYDEEHNRLAAMSIPRDTYVQYNGRAMLINSVYGAGGINATAKAVKELTGLKINYYVQFGVGTFAELVDLLGGVEFDVPQNMNYDDDVQGLHIHLQKGMQTLNGKQAEDLVRFRGYPQADLKRVEVQQNLLKALLEQKLSAEYITDIPHIYSSVKDNIKCNMSLKDMLVYGKSMLKLNLSTDVYTCTMPTLFTGVDAHLYYDRIGTDKVMEQMFLTEGPVTDNAPYDVDNAETTN